MSEDSSRIDHLKVWAGALFGKEQPPIDRGKLVKLFSLLRPKLLRRRDLKRLKKKVFEDPTPEGVRDLAHRLLFASETEEALRVVEEGVERFPESDSLQSFLTLFKKNRLRATIDRLLQILETRPLPEAYGQLADIYRDVGELDQALDVCQRCLEKFPESDIPYLVQGKIGLDRYKRTLTVRDGRFAIDNFHRATVIDPHNLKAHIHLAEIYCGIGASRKALDHLEVVTTQTVVDDRLKTLEANLVESLSSVNQETQELDVDSLLIQVETQERLAHDPWNLAVTSRDHDEDAAMAEFSDRFGSLEGSHDVALVVGDQVAEPAEGEEGHALSAVVAQVASVGDASARKMDLGNMTGAIATGDFGHIVIRKVRGASAAVHLSDENVARSVREPIQDFLARHFG